MQTTLERRGTLHRRIEPSDLKPEQQRFQRTRFALFDYRTGAMCSWRALLMKTVLVGKRWCGFKGVNRGGKVGERVGLGYGAKVINGL